MASVSSADATPSVVGRVSALLRAVAEREPQGASTTQIAAATGLPRPTAHRLLTTLDHEHLVERDADTGAWHLGAECFLLGASATHRHDVAHLARPIVRKLAHDTGESAFFSVRRGDETVCVLSEEGSFPLRSHVLHQGIRFPLGVASAGLAILAFLPERERSAYLQQTDLVARFGADHSRNGIEARIESTRARGFAVNPGLIVEGSWGLGAAVFDAHGEPRWALTLTGVESRISPRSDELGRLLLDAAHALAHRMNPAGRA